MQIGGKFKNAFKNSSERVTDRTQELVEKSRKAGSEGMDSIRNFFSDIGDKVSDATTAVKLKYDEGYLEKSFNLESFNLGKLVLKLNRTGVSRAIDEAISEQLKRMTELNKTIQSGKQAYESLRKELSDDYLIKQLSKNLSASGAIIEQVVISKKSNVVNKLLKEIVLPKEVLISAILRDKEVIIPDGNTQLRVGDQVTVIGKNDDVTKITKRLSAS